MASPPVDNLKPEKAKAFNSYRMQQKLKQVMHLFNLLLALFLFCRSSLLPIIIEFCSFFFSEAMSLFSNSIYVFIIGNTIIMFIYILTRQGGNHTSVTDAVYHPYFSLNNNAASTGDHPISEPESIKSISKTDSEGETPEPSDKQIVLTVFPPEKQGGSFSDKCLKEGLTAETETSKVGLAESMDVKEKFTEITETTMRTLRTVTSKAGGEKVSEVQRRYKRVQSDNYERRVVVKHGRGQLRRLNRENRSRSQSQSQLVRYSNGPSAETQRRLRSVEDMTNEEFNRTIEDFIAKQKKKHRDELEKTLALTWG